MKRTACLFFLAAAYVALLALVVTQFHESQPTAEVPRAATDPHDQESKRWKVERLDLEVALAPDRNEMICMGTARLQLQEKGSHGPTLQIGNVGEFLHLNPVHGARVEIDRSGTIARIRFPDPLPVGTELTVEFQYHNRGRAYRLIVNPQVCLASSSSQWYPHVMGSYRTAPGKTEIRVPGAWKTLSNGSLVHTREQGGERTDVWETEDATPRSFAAGPYEVRRAEIDGCRLAVYLLSAKPEECDEHIRILTRCMEALQARFGPCPTASYSMVTVPGELVGWGACSVGGISMIRTGLILTINPLPIYAHEATHAWWGIHVKSDDLWISESLAHYGAVLALEAQEGKESATEFLRFSRRGALPTQCAQGFFRMERGGRDRPLKDLNSKGVVTSHDLNLTLSKGPWILHMLRRRLGDDLFFKTLKEIIRDFGGKEIDTAAFQTAFMEAAPSDRDLANFFDQWLGRTGAPVLDLTWSPLPGPEQTGLEIKIVQNTEPYRLHLEVAVDTEAGTEEHTLFLTEKEQDFTLALSSPPTHVRMDPHHDLLIWKDEYGPRPGSALSRFYGAIGR